MLLVAPPVAAQRGWDAQVHALVLARDSTLVTGGLGAGIRVGRGLRLAATMSGGWMAPDVMAGRSEVMVVYHLYPARPTRAGWYVGGGLAAELARGRGRGLVQALLGVEARPWRGGGLFAEVGVGGGVRIAAGYRTVRLARRRSGGANRNGRGPVRTRHRFNLLRDRRRADHPVAPTVSSFSSVRLITGWQ
jgi:hypothetical protein